MWSGCLGSGDYVELLGGNGVDTSKMFPVADLCFSLSGLGEFEVLQITSSVNLLFSTQTIIIWKHDFFLRTIIIQYFIKFYCVIQ